MDSDRLEVEPEPKGSRLLYLDNIKVLFTILVIFQHVMVTYSSQGWWYYRESIPTDPISSLSFTVLIAFGGLFQASLMGLFFLLGGYFTPKSYDRKSSRRFLIERLLRLGVPLLLYFFLISPALVIIVTIFTSQPFSANPFDYLLWGPMWYLAVLLIFTAGYVLWRQITKVDWVQRKIPEDFAIPRYIYLLLLAIGFGFLTYLVRIVSPIDAFPFGIPVAQIIQYVFTFSVGVIAVRYQWFDKMTRRHAQIWSATIIAAILIVFTLGFTFLGVSDLTVFTGGASWPAFLFAVLDNITSMGMMFVIIWVFYSKFNKQGSTLRNLSSSAYQMYLIHPPVLVGISLGLAAIPIIPILKLVIVFPLGVLVCYLLSHYILRKIPFR
jgi:MFS family permease